MGAYAPREILRGAQIAEGGVTDRRALSPYGLERGIDAFQSRPARSLSKAVVDLLLEGGTNFSHIVQLGAQKRIFRKNGRAVWPGGKHPGQQAFGDGSRHSAMLGHSPASGVPSGRGARFGEAILERHSLPFLSRRDLSWFKHGSSR